MAPNDPSPTHAAPDYTPYYCEENIYRLAARRDLIGDQAEVVFITNARAAVACWFQRAAPEPGQALVWDYHVVLVDPHATGPRLWDLDCILGCPLPAATWLAATFQDPTQVPARYHPSFRVVAAAAFLRDFATDRSHMRTRHGWRKPPPPWTPPGPVDGVAMNLDLFRDADPTRGPGTVLDRRAFTRHLGL